MPFGLAPACRIYKTVTGEVYRLLRPHNQNMSYLIDDALFAFETGQQDLFRKMTLVWLPTTLESFVLGKV